MLVIKLGKALLLRLYNHSSIVKEKYESGQESISWICPLLPGAIGCVCRPVVSGFACSFFNLTLLLRLENEIV